MEARNQTTVTVTAVRVTAVTQVAVNHNAFNVYLMITNNTHSVALQIFFLMGESRGQKFT
jgi:hypothetical protein